jgi:hypothetical protein
MTIQHSPGEHWMNDQGTKEETVDVGGSVNVCIEAKRALCNARLLYL